MLSQAKKMGIIMIISIISTFKHAFNKHLKINIQAGKKKRHYLKQKSKYTQYNSSNSEDKLNWRVFGFTLLLDNNQFKVTYWQRPSSWAVHEKISPSAPFQDTYRQESFPPNLPVDPVIRSNIGKDAQVSMNSTTPASVHSY